MSFALTIKDALILASVATLIGLGLVITLANGPASVRRERSGHVVANVSGTLVGLAGCAIALALVQQLVGFTWAWGVGR